MERPGDYGTWVFDVDGCLVDSLTGGSLRPMAAEILRTVRAAGHPVLLWSAGGEAHARTVAERIGIGALVDGYYEKAARGADRRWLTSPLTDAHLVDMFVDDRPEELPADSPSMGVHPYIAPDPHDVGLRHVLAAVRALCQAPPAS